MNRQALTFEEIQFITEFIEKYPFRVAKSMLSIPHEYVVRKNCDDAQFVKFATLIREKGYPLRFGKSTYTYLNFGEHKYWTMGAPMDITIILNRAKI